LVCGGHGECTLDSSINADGSIKLEGKCKCDAFYLGDDCFHGCPNKCSGHGKCELNEQDGAVCKCESNFMGADCSAAVCGKEGGSSFLNSEIGKCTCEKGLTCCSRESTKEEKERDATLTMLTKENALMASKLKTLQTKMATLLN